MKEERARAMAAARSSSAGHSPRPVTRSSSTQASTLAMTVASTLTTSSEVEKRGRELFRSHFVEDIRVKSMDVHKEIEEKKQELRRLVG